MTKGKREAQVVEAWGRVASVDDVCEQVSVGIVIQPSRYYVSEGEGIRAFRSANVLENKVSDKDWVYLSREGHRANSKSILQSGDVLVVRSGAPGTACVVPPEFSDSNCIDVVFARPKQDLVLPEYLCALTNSSAGRKHVVENQGGLALKHFNVGAFKGMKILLPPIPEQHKITTILGTWSEATENLLRVRELREKQYLGLRDYLVDWSTTQRAVKDFLKPVSRPIPKPTSGYRALSIRSHGKGTFDRFVENPESVEMDTLYVAKAGDIIVNITFAWEGAVALVPRDHDGCLVSHRFPIFVPDIERVDARYLRHVLRMARFTYLLGIVSPGGAGRNRVLSKSDFLDLMVPLPPLDRQRRVAMILDDAENAIAAEEKYLSALNRQKRGLMQKLLTGEWRVRA